MSDVADVLERAAALIEPQGAWTQGVLGRGADGRILMARDLDQAVCFCAEGAIRRASGNAPFEDAFRAVKAVIHNDTIGWWNDRPRRTQRQVVEALRAAAKLARESGYA